MKILFILLTAALGLSACNPLSGQLDQSVVDQGFHPGYVQTEAELQALPILLRGGQVLALSFTLPSEMSSARLEYSLDNGLHYNLLSSLSSYQTSYLWNVPTSDTVLGRIRLISTVNGIEKTLESDLFSIDATVPGAPSATLQSASQSNSASVALTIADCSDRQGIFVSESTTPPSATAAGWVTCQTTAGAIHYSVASADGAKTLYVYAKDEAGNISTSSSVNVTIDRTAPILTWVTAPAMVSILKGSNSYSLSWTASDATTSIQSLKLYYAEDGSSYDAGTSLSTSATSLSWTIPSHDTSTAKLKLVAVDTVGNTQSIVAGPFTIDSSLPTVSITDLSGPYRGGTSVNVSLSASDTLSGLNTFKLQYASNGTTFADVATLSTSATSYSWTIPSDNTTTAKLKVIAVDVAGNESTASTSAFTIDSTAPSAPSITLASANPTNSTAASLTVNSCSDFSKIYVSETNTAPAFNAAGWQTCSTGAGAISSTLSNADGTKTLYAFAQDAVGNVSVSSSLVVTLDRTVPVVTLSSLTGGEIVSGLLTQSVEWSASDSGSGLKTNSAKIEVSSDSGVSWSTVASNQTTAGPYNWSAGSSANGTHYQIQITVSDAAGNTASASSPADFTMDSEAPTLTGAEMTVNDSVSGDSTNTNYVQVSFKASDTATKITHFCLQYNDSTQPDSDSTCWSPVSALGQSAATSVVADHYSFGLGMGTSLYHIYAWVKDQASNISELGPTDGTDHVSISYTAPQAPTITSVIGTSSSTPANPPSKTDLTINQGTDVYIQWKVASAPSGLGSTPISLFVTTDNLTFDPISGAGALLNGNNGCAPDSDHTGCFKWANGSPANTFYSVRAVVTDSAEITAAGTSSPINSWPPINFLAGATDPGTNGSASSAMFINSQGTCGDGQSFVVTKGGIVYFRDRYRGILMIDPTTGNQVILIPLATSGYADGTVTGLTTGATVGKPTRLALDFQDRLLIQETNSIRRYDPSSHTLTTIIGGPSATSTTATSSAATTRITSSVPFACGQAFPLFAVPDGRIYFGSENPGSSPSGSRIRIYTPADSTVRSVYYSGVGTSEGPTEDISNYAPVGTFYGFDPSTSDLDASMMLLSRYGLASYRVNFNPITGATLPTEYMDQPPSGYLSRGIVGMDGEAYAFGPGKIIHYSKIARTWTTLAGSATAGISDDSIVAFNHMIDPSDLFVNASGKIYFFEHGVIRTIDQDGKLVSLMGSRPSSGDGGDALNARIGMVDDFKLWNNGVGSGDQIVFTDSSEVKIRQFQVGGQMTKLAGNGNQGTPSTVNPAVDEPLLLDLTHVAFTIAVDPSDGTIYSNTRRKGISKLPQATDVWEDLIGGSSYGYFAADGKPGNQITPSSGYTPSIMGYDGSNLIAGWYRYSGSYIDSMFKIYPLDGIYTQAPFAGVLGGYNHDICADATLLTDCALPLAGLAINQLVWDGYAHTWVGMPSPSEVTTSGKQVFTMTEGGSIHYLVKLPDYAPTMTVRHDATHNLIYYCGYTDGKLHRYDVDLATTDPANADSAYAWPIPAMKCGSHSLIYSASRDSLIFAYSVNGIWGIAEYLNP